MLVVYACRADVVGHSAVKVSYIGLRRWAGDSPASVRVYGELAAVLVPLALGTCLLWRPSPWHMPGS